MALGWHWVGTRARLTPYLPNQFAETRQDVLLSLVATHRLAAIVRQGTEGLVADHIPLIIDQRGDLLTLRGHVARANPLWCLADDKDVLAIFHRPQTYSCTHGGHFQHVLSEGTRPASR
ncbi:MAG: FMN-binding negative transcriptional regulator [Burkholderiales bacterium]